MKIGIKITAIAVLPIILTALVILAIALYQNLLLHQFIDSEIDRQARNEAQKIAQSVYLMCRSAQESVQQTVDANLRVAADILEHRPGHLRAPAGPLGGRQPVHPAVAGHRPAAHAGRQPVARADP